MAFVSTRRTLRSTAAILDEIFADSDSGDSDESDDDFGVDAGAESDVEDSNDESPAQSESESEAPPPPAKKSKPEEPSFIWKDDTFVPAKFAFTGDPGINPDVISTLPDEATPLDYFSIFMNDEVIDIIVRETNKYAKQYIDSATLLPHSRVHKWYPTTAPEMKLFLGIALMMGLVRKPRIEFYWTETDLYLTPAFSKIMTRNRFSLLLKFLHFSDNASKPEGDDRDRLYKIREIYDLLTESFQAAYEPGEHVVIDEGMIRWFGRGFRTYLPSKRAKYGMKAYKLCDESGYTYKFQLYTGKSELADDQIQGLPGLVMNLMDGLLERGRVLYMDNYYNSPTLALMLHKRETHVVGTLRMNRKGLPKDLTKQKLKRGDLVFRTCPPITVFVWHDKRDVNFITTLHDASMATVPGKVDRLTGRPVEKPAAVIEYNRYMGAVDTSDQMVLLNSSVRKTLKWTKKLFFHLLDLAATNAYVLYAKNTKQIKHFRFAKQLCSELVSSVTSDPAVIRPGRAGRITSESLQRLEFRSSSHWPVTIPATRKQETPRRECVVCKEHKAGKTGKRWKTGESRKRVQTRYVCDGCADRPALCITPCFKAYHTQRHY